MRITIKKECNFNELFDICDSKYNKEAKDVLYKVEEAGKQDKLMIMLNSAFYHDVPTASSVVDYLTYNSDSILDKLNIKTKFYIDNLGGEAYEEAISETIIELSPYNKVVAAIREALPDASDSERKVLYKQVEVAANAECLFFTAEGAIIAD